MPRFPRLVVPGYPHHVTQRGVRRQQTFFDDADYRAYTKLVAGLKAEAGAEIWAYCLMPNHIHMIVIPEEKQSLAKLFGTAHHRYAKRVNALHDWRGHLWQERFFSVVMDEVHTLAAIRYVELNPVRAGLGRRAEDWQWSSVHKHLGDQSDSLVDDSALCEAIGDWRGFLSEQCSTDFVESLRSQTNSGRPRGDDQFVEVLERKTGRRIRRFNPGPAPKR
jgi:putative transposase